MWGKTKEQRDRDLNDEIQFHMEAAKRDRMERGESESQADLAVRREFGNPGLTKEVTREMWGGGSVERLLQDIRYGVRVLAKSPAFTIVAILSLALGIGANTALFSVVNGVILNPLPFPESDQLVTMQEKNAAFGEKSISYPNFLDWQKQAQSFQSLAAFRPDSYAITGRGEGERVPGQMISHELLPMLGVTPILGRNFTADEDRLGGEPVVLISERLWKRKLGGSTDILGQSITLNGTNRTIIGVVPENLRVQFMRFRGINDIFAPLGQWTNPDFRERGSAWGLGAMGRMKPGVTVEQARTEMETIAANLATQYPDANQGITATVVPLKERMVGEIQPFLLTLFGAVCFVLLIVCVNVANLLLARSSSRSREFAVRAALGANRTRMLRQLFTESMLIAVAGGALGILLAAWGIKAALAALPDALPRADGISLDGSVLLFTLGISLATGLLFGLMPALKLAKPDLNSALKEGVRGTTSGSHRTQRVLVVAEVALAFVLLVGAGLMIRTLTELWNVDPGFTVSNALVFDVALPPAMKEADAAAVRAAFRDIESSVAALPGVEAAAIQFGSFPLMGDYEFQYWRDDEPEPTNPEEGKQMLWYSVQPGYFAAMNIPLKRGRLFTAADGESSRNVAIIDETMANEEFPDQDPVGRFLNTEGAGKLEIIGVVGHTKQWALTPDHDTLHVQVYTPFMQLPDDYIKRVSTGVNVVVRSGIAPTTLFDTIGRTIEERSPDHVVSGLITLEEVIEGSLATQHFFMMVLGAFAAVALLLASIGIYGVVSYLVGQRMHEIGIRMALGAQRRDVLAMVLRQGGLMALIGVGVGIAAALGLTRLLEGLLYGVRPTDPVTFGGVGLLLCGIALLACYLPARRAMKVDPMVVLRYE